MKKFQTKLTVKKVKLILYYPISILYSCLVSYEHDINVALKNFELSVFADKSNENKNLKSTFN